MTETRRILQVGTHSTLHPIHGGQLRSRNIGRVLEEAGYSVRGIAACFQQSHDIVNDREIILDISKARNWRGAVAGGAFVDYFSCVAVEDDPTLRAAFFRFVAGARPDIVLLEHPWMWPLVRLIPEVAAGQIPVVYDSQNVEAALKRKIVGEMGLGAAAVLDAEAALIVAEELERDVVATVVAVTACTVEDAQVFDTWGARRTVVAGNGSTRRPATGLRRLLPSMLPMDCRYGMMVGSGHLPNVTGFENLVLPWLARLQPGQRIVAAGGASDWLRSRLAKNSVLFALEGRLVLLGRVNDLTLAALIENAACILLPIEFGGGSNIKTAEALLSDRRIVASPASMRGFDEYLNIPGVTVADGPQAFGAAVLAAMADRSPTLRKPESVAALTWDAKLAPLVALVEELTNGAR